mgnify:CR=1 FL=1
MSYILQSMTVVFSPMMLAMVCGAVFAGIVIGAIPGLTATMALVLLVPITYAMDTNTAVILLISTYVGGVSGGFISALLLGIPGTPSSVASLYDGYELVKKGQHERALGISTIASAIGGLISGIVLVLFSPILASFALKFGPFEYLSLILFTFATIASFSEGSMIKAFLAGMIGLLFSTVGTSSIAGIERFTFGSNMLAVGFSSMPALIGIYAVPQILNELKTYEPGSSAKLSVKTRPKEMMKSISDFKGRGKNIAVSSVIGTLIGILPGIGPGLSNIVAYSKAKDVSKHPEEFGTGSPEGLMAPDIAKNASMGGALIPMLTMGIPGDSSTLVLIGALMLQGLNPGPLLYRTSMDVVTTVFVTFFIAHIVMLIFSFFLMPIFVKALSIPNEYLFPIVIVFCVTGSFALNSNYFDVITFLIFGMLGYIFSRIGLPSLPVVIGLMLGKMAENQLSIGLSVSSGSILPIFTRPIAMVILLMTVISLLRPFIFKKPNQEGSK